MEIQWYGTCVVNFRKRNRRYVESSSPSLLGSAIATGVSLRIAAGDGTKSDSCRNCERVSRMEE